MEEEECRDKKDWGERKGVKPGEPHKGGRSIREKGLNIRRERESKEG